ncbi:YphA family membrane protein [Alteribacillus iranensis]|uniref:Uncharacterized protein n=1 Tax=Alteribacillus iranensis TaxID=930128 RepID=A0A1I1ZSM7_9BACI|nr:hypothetical protein SAMN05192532_101370 [Alteribacillus iranensis]
MDLSITFIICWMMWICVTFFASKQNTWRLPGAAFILLVICLLPLEWSGSQILIRPVMFLFFLAGIGVTSRLSSIIRIRTYILACSFAFLFASFRLAEWYEPVIFLFGRVPTYVVSFSLVFIIFFRSNRERLACALLSGCGGELLYQSHIFSFTSVYVAGETFFLNYVVCIAAVGLVTNIISSLIFSRKPATSFSHLHLPGS